MSVNLEDLKRLRESTGTSLTLCKKALEETGNFDAAMKRLREKGIAAAAKKAGRTAAEGHIVHVSTEKQEYLYEINCETDFVAKTEAFQALQQEINSALKENTPQSLQECLELDVQGQKLSARIQETAGSLGENIVFRRLSAIKKTDNHSIQSYIHGPGRIGVLVEIAPAHPEAGLDIALQVAAQSPEYAHVTDIPEAILTEMQETFTKQQETSGKPPAIVEKIVAGKIKNWQKDVVLTEQVFLKDDSKTLKEHLQSLKVELKSFIRLELGQQS